MTLIVPPHIRGLLAEAESDAVALVTHIGWMEASCKGEDVCTYLTMLKASAESITHSLARLNSLAEEQVEDRRGVNRK